MIQLVGRVSWKHLKWWDLDRDRGDGCNCGWNQGKYN